METIILSGCNKKTIIVKMGAYFFTLGALYQNKHSLTIESLYEHLSFSSCEEEMNCCVRIALYFFHHQGITIDTM